VPRSIADRLRTWTASKTAPFRSDGVIHLAFNHDFSKYVANCEDDRHVIEALGSVLSGSDRPLIVTSGTGIANTVPGQPAREDDVAASSAAVPRAASEEAANAVAADGTNVSAVRLPQVHNTVKQGFITYAVAVAREKNVSAYVGDGRNRWPAVHLLDAAGSAGWRSRRQSAAQGITRSQTKACHSAHFVVGQPVEVSVADEGVLVKRAGSPKLTLAQKLAAFDPERHGGEAMPARPVGNEAM
jgi:nucleoside-diphosphate-sugar epimerase